MGRNHAIVMVSCSNHSCRILDSGLQVMQRGITFQVLEHLPTIITRTIVACPIPTNGEFVIAEHIHHSHFRNGHTEQIGTLRHAGTHQQATIRTTYDSNLVFIGIVIINKVFGSGNEIVKYILFLHLRTCHVPLFTIFATTTQVCLCINTAIFQERNT